MKKNKLILLVLPLLLSGCTSNSEEPLIKEKTFERAAQLLNRLDKNNVNSFDFIDRSYNFDNISSSKYVVTGDYSKAKVDYEARHQYKLYSNNVIEDKLECDALTGVENTNVVSITNATGQIFDDGHYLYDYFIGPDEDSKFVNCYAISKYRTINDYFNYLTLLDDTANMFLNVGTLYPTENGYTEPFRSIKEEDNKETYIMSVSYPGDSTYMAFTYEYEVSFDSTSLNLDHLRIRLVQFKDAVSGDYESEARTYTEYTLSNLNYGEKTEFNGKLNDFSMIREDKIYNKPHTIVDLKDYKNGKLPSDKSLEVARNILAYGEDISECNYEFIYHDAFDIADAKYTVFGDAQFKGTITSYSNDIQINSGSIKKIDRNDIPYGDGAPYEIYTIANDTGVEKYGKFEKYITPCCAFLTKNGIQNEDNPSADLRAYTGANPLFFPEFRDLMNYYHTYNLGKHSTGLSTIEITSSGEKNGDYLTISASTRIYNKTVDDTFAFTFEINNNVMESVTLVVTGQSQGTKYVDTYKAICLSNKKKEFKGELPNFDDITAQVTMRSFYAI